MPAIVIAILILGSICAASGTVLLKLGATGQTTLEGFINGWIVGGLGLYGLGALFWIYGLSRQNLTNVYPFTVLTFILVYVAGIAYLGEIPSRSAVLGVAFILFGLYLVTRSTA